MTSAQSSPELAVALACARVPRDRDIRTACARPLDWSLLLRLAHGHGLTPLLYWQLSHCADIVPPAVLEELRGRFERNAARNIALARELHRILDLLRTRGIAAIPYKGPALAQIAYGDLGLRHFIDLDILVRKRDVRPARDLLKTRGYRPRLSLTTAQESALLDAHCEYALQREGDGICVELHWEIVPPEFGLAEKAWGFWDIARPVPLLGSTILCPPPEDLLLILCVHGSKHLWRRIGWVCDVAELVRAHTDLDWSRAFGRARSLGAERMMRLGLCLAGELLAAELPAPVEAGLGEDEATRVLATRVVQWLTTGSFPPERSLEEARFHAAMRERRRDRIRYWRRMVLTGTVGDWEALPLPGALFFLYPLLRPFRLAWRHRHALAGRGR